MEHKEGKAGVTRSSTFTPPHLLDSRRWAGLRVGLLGGSFNPPHEGHLHISLVALRDLRLDFVWWLVTPHNPLKEKSSLWPYETRLSLCRNLVVHPRIIVTDLERQLGVNRSYDTIKGLKSAFPATQFIMLAGTDNAQNFHRWHRWQGILEEIPVAFIARPPAISLVSACPVRQMASQHHVALHGGEPGNLIPGTSYWILERPHSAHSSTEIRNKIS